MVYSLVAGCSGLGWWLFVVFALHWACLFGICCLLFDIVFVLLVSLICLFYGGWLLLVVMFWLDGFGFMVGCG